MILRINFKTPDAVDCAICDALEREEENWHMNDEQKDETEERLKEDLNKWIEYGECLTVEYDSDKHSISIVPV